MRLTAPLARLPALVARAAHEVVSEYRRLEAPGSPEPARGELSCTSARVESSWEPKGWGARPVVGFCRARDQR